MDDLKEGDELMVTMSNNTAVVAQPGGNRLAKAWPKRCTITIQIGWFCITITWDRSEMKKTLVPVQDAVSDGPMDCLSAGGVCRVGKCGRPDKPRGLGLPCDNPKAVCCSYTEGNAYNSENAICKLDGII